jgi:hypothetical protein
MTSSTPVLFTWEGTDNPNDPEGVATYKCNGVSTSIAFNTFEEASKLAYLIDRAYELGKNNALDRAIPSVQNLLNELRYS